MVNIYKSTLLTEKSICYTIFFLCKENWRIIDVFGSMQKLLELVIIIDFRSYR